jgi:hypothetical protein
MLASLVEDGMCDVRERKRALLVLADLGHEAWRKSKAQTQDDAGPS